MKNLSLNRWQDVHAEVLQRIQSRIWPQGKLIPNEADLAVEFGCARSTVNRALRAAAEAGLLERRRKAGTRVVAQPIHRAVFNIPVIRKEIEDRHKSYSYALISEKRKKPPVQVRAMMKLQSNTSLIHLRSLHLADGIPYVHEERWINSDLLPAATKVNFEKTNANEWLLANAPFTAGDVTFSATNADAFLADVLCTEIDTALFTIQRTTWNEGVSITFVKLTYAPGYCVHMSI